MSSIEASSLLRSPYAFGDLYKGISITDKAEMNSKEENIIDLNFMFIGYNKIFFIIF